MREIPLTNGGVTLVDDQDFLWLSAWKWRGVLMPNGKRYAARGHDTVLMHRVLLPAEEDVDHKNWDTLDNQRHNLRAATRSQNGANRPKNKNNTSGVKGVDWHAGAWRARIMQNRKHFSLGHFSSREEAALAYQKAALEKFGEFACSV